MCNGCFKINRCNTHTHTHMQDLLDLLGSMLCPQGRRLSALQLLQHPFMQRHKGWGVSLCVCVCAFTHVCVVCEWKVRFVHMVSLTFYLSAHTYSTAATPEGKRRSGAMTIWIWMWIHSSDYTTLDHTMHNALHSPLSTVYRQGARVWTEIWYS
jgi:hypothetical protein